MKTIIVACAALLAVPAFSQGALDVLDRAGSSSSRSWGNTLDNAQRRTQMDQVHQENNWFNRCMYQTGGDAARCGGIRQTEVQPRPEPEGYPARLVSQGEQVQTVTGLWATKCIYEVHGQQFVKLFARCPSRITVQ